jgi:hypothetical protein
MLEALLHRERLDYDVAMFLRAMADRWQEFDRLADLSTDILDETDGR